MKVPCALSLAAMMLVAAVAVVGCGGDKAIEIRYDRPALYDISPKIKRVAVAPFNGQTPADRRWGEVASDKLVALLDQHNRKFSRYELVDRRGLKTIMDERDLRTAISDTASAGQVGKLAHVQAVIYGNVTVMHRDEHATRQVFDFASRSMRTVPYVRRVCQATANFTMDDIDTGKTIAAVTVSRDYDSDKQKKDAGSAIGKVVGVVGDDVAAIDATINELLDACVQDFVGKISPHEEAFKVMLESGRSKQVDQGNSLAVEGEYKEALACYLKAIQEQPNDAGACFNAGLMCETTGDFKAAEQYYTQAIELKATEQKFIKARRRVRQETTVNKVGKGPADVGGG